MGGKPGGVRRNLEQKRQQQSDNINGISNSSAHNAAKVNIKQLKYMNINMVYGIYKQSGGVTYFRELLFDVNIMVRQHMDMVDILIKEKRKSLNIEAEPWISAELQRSTETSSTGNNKKEDVEEDINHRSIIQESVDLLKETLDMTEDSTRIKNCNDETIGIKMQILGRVNRKKMKNMQLTKTSMIEPTRTI